MLNIPIAKFTFVNTKPFCQIFDAHLSSRYIIIFINIVCVLEHRSDSWIVLQHAPVLHAPIQFVTVDEISPPPQLFYIIIYMHTAVFIDDIRLNFTSSIYTVSEADNFVDLTIVKDPPIGDAVSSTTGNNITIHFGTSDWTAKGTRSAACAS